MKKPMLWLISFLVFSAMSFAGVADVNVPQAGFNDPVFVADYLTPTGVTLLANTGTIAWSYVHSAQRQHGLSKSVEPIDAKNTYSNHYSLYADRVRWRLSKTYKTLRNVRYFSGVGACVDCHTKPVPT